MACIFPKLSFLECSYIKTVEIWDVSPLLTLCFFLLFTMYSGVVPTRPALPALAILPYNLVIIQHFTPHMLVTEASGMVQGNHEKTDIGKTGGNATRNYKQVKTSDAKGLTCIGVLAKYENWYGATAE